MSYIKYTTILCIWIRGVSRAAATSKMERFVIIVNDFQPLTIITKRSILDVAAALDPPLWIFMMFDIKAIWSHAKAYLQTNRTSSMMLFFAKIVNSNICT